MRLSRLLLLAGIGYGINAFLKTQKGKDLKNDLVHRMDGWKKEVENLVSSTRNKTSTAVDTPVENNIGSMY